MDGAGLPPSPRDRPPPAPYPSPPSSRGTYARVSAAAFEQHRPSAYRSLSSSMRAGATSAWDPPGARYPSSSASSFEYIARATTRRSHPTFSASHDAPGPYQAASASARWPRRGVYGDKAFASSDDPFAPLQPAPPSSRLLSASASTLNPVPQLAPEFDEARSIQPLDVHTANVLAKQQAQLMELNAQLRALQTELANVRGEASAGRPVGASLGASGRSLGTIHHLRDEFDPRASVSARSDVTGRAAGSADASTNTVWTPLTPEEQLAARFGDDFRETKAEPPAFAADEWSYEGGGRKSRGCVTDPRDWSVGSPGDDLASANAGRASAAGARLLRASAARGGGIGVIRRSRVSVISTQRANPSPAIGSSPGRDASSRGVGTGSAPRLSPAKPSDVVGDFHAAAPPMPDLPLPSRPEMRAMQRRLDVPVEGRAEHAAGPPPPHATATRTTRVDGGDGEGEPSARESVDAAAAAGAGAGAAAPFRLIPSANSAFTRVGAEGGARRSLDDPGRRSLDGAGDALRSILPGDPARRRRASHIDHGLARFSHGSDDSSASSLPVDPPSHLHVVAPPPPRSFARSPLFADLGDDDSPRGAEEEGDDGDNAVLRVSRDTFAELSLRNGGAGASEGGSDAGFGCGETDLGDDETDAGTAVTGTTTGRAAGEWAPPDRWGLRKMSEAVCWEEGAEGEATSPRTPRGDGVASPGPPAGYWPEDMPEGMPVITYEPLSDDESSDDEEMREILRKYDIGETR